MSRKVYDRTRKRGKKSRTSGIFGWGFYLSGPEKRGPLISVNPPNFTRPHLLDRPRMSLARNSPPSSLSFFSPFHQASLAYPRTPCLPALILSFRISGIPPPSSPTDDIALKLILMITNLQAHILTANQRSRPTHFGRCLTPLTPPRLFVTQNSPEF